MSDEQVSAAFHAMDDMLARHAGGHGGGVVVPFRVAPKRTQPEIKVPAKRRRRSSDKSLEERATWSLRDAREAQRFHRQRKAARRSSLETIPEARVEHCGKCDPANPCPVVEQVYGYTCTRSGVVLSQVRVAHLGRVQNGGDQVTETDGRVRGSAPRLSEAKKARRIELLRKYVNDALHRLGTAALKEPKKHTFRHCLTAMRTEAQYRIATFAETHGFISLELLVQEAQAIAAYTESPESKEARDVLSPERIEALVQPITSHYCALYPNESPREAKVTAFTVATIYWLRNNSAVGSKSRTTEARRAAIGMPAEMDWVDDLPPFNQLQYIFKKVCTSKSITRFMRSFNDLKLGTTNPSLMLS